MPELFLILLNSLLVRLYGQMPGQVSVNYKGGKFFFQKKLIVKKTFKLVRRFTIIVKSTFIDAGYDYHHVAYHFHSE
jgi:hypothetical protein